MGKFLRVLVVFFLLFSVAALTLGILLFMRRELLKGRTQALETAFIELAPSIEDTPGSVETPPEYPEQDMSPVSFEIPEQLEYSTYWSNYKHSLEVQEPVSVVTLKDKQKQLMTYYQVSPATGEKVKDEITGGYLTSGPGTMNELLKYLNDKSFAQLERLNTTRQQLKDIRTELISCIEKLNKEKGEHRQTHAVSEQRRLKILELEARITELEQQVAQLQAEVEALNAQLAEKVAEIAILQENLDEANRTIEDLKQRLEVAQAKAIDDSNVMPGDQNVPGPASPIEAGQKGSVVQVNPEWEFVIVEMSDAFITEVLGEDGVSGAVRGVELWVNRAGETDTFVTKLSVTHINKEKKLAIASILPSWQQLPVKVGDEVRF